MYTGSKIIISCESQNFLLKVLECVLNKWQYLLLRDQLKSTKKILPNLLYCYNYHLCSVYSTLPLPQGFIWSTFWWQHHTLTTSGTSPALCMRADLMDWKKSTTPSVFSRSNWAWMQMKVPVRPTPLLQGQCKHTENKTVYNTSSKWIESYKTKNTTFFWDSAYMYKVTLCTQRANRKRWLTQSTEKSPEGTIIR